MKDRTLEQRLGDVHAQRARQRQIIESKAALAAPQPASGKRRVVATVRACERCKAPTTRWPHCEGCGSGTYFRSHYTAGLPGGRKDQE